MASKPSRLHRTGRRASESDHLLRRYPRMRGSPTDPLDMSSRPVEQRCHDVLDAAHAAGIRYVDPARSYGMAEAFLGSWLNTRGLSRAAVTIGSKWGYSYIAGAATVDQLTSNLSGVAFAASSTELPSMATPPDEYWAHRRTLVWK
jgi:hypothetical protein